MFNGFINDNYYIYWCNVCRNSCNQGKMQEFAGNCAGMCRNIRNLQEYQDPGTPAFKLTGHHMVIPHYLLLRVLVCSRQWRITKLNKENQCEPGNRHERRLCFHADGPCISNSFKAMCSQLRLKLSFLYPWGFPTGSLQPLEKVLVSRFGKLWCLCQKL